MRNYYQFKEQDARDFAAFVHIKARQKGKELWFQKCPYCGNQSNDREKFSINLDTGQFNCFRASCGAKGNMIDLSKDFGFSLGADTDAYYSPKMTYRKFAKKQIPEAKEAAVKYLASRGISRAVSERYKISTQKENENILVFPFLDENGDMQTAKFRKVDYVKGRDKNKEWFVSNCKPILFGMYQCDTKCKTLVLTEGQIDSLSVTEAGIKNAVSVPNGANGFTWIPYCWDWIRNFEEIIVFGDCEHGHITLLETINKRFGKTLKVKYIPEESYKECKDANEILQKYGAASVREAIENARQVPDERIVDMADVRIENGAEKEHFSSGIGYLDGIIGGLYFGQLIVLTGKRGEGKSTFASQILMNALKAGYISFAYSGELDKENFKEWFSRQVAGDKYINKKNNGSYKQPTYSITTKTEEKINRWLRGRAFIYSNELIDDARNEQDILIDTIDTAAKQYGCRVFLIDNLMTAITDDASSDLYRKQTEFVRKLKRAAQLFNLCIILVAHPRKTTYNLDNDDVAGSANITNLADTVICYTRPKGEENRDSPNRILTVSKNRMNGKTDTQGMTLYFQESSKRISVNNIFDKEVGWENICIDDMDDDSDLEMLLEDE